VLNEVFLKIAPPPFCYGLDIITAIEKGEDHVERGDVRRGSDSHVLTRAPVLE
jgi:hypothetical protein